jgi:iron-sulfur cluster assembly accessory protein
MLQITSAALSEIKRMQHSRDQPNSYFRLDVIEGGCAGYCYRFTLCDRTTERDRQWKIQDLLVLVDEACLIYLENLRLDYAEDLMGGGFRFHDPNLSNTCSCGLSFSLPSKDIDEIAAPLNHHSRNRNSK